MSDNQTESELAPGPDEVTIESSPETVEEGHKVTISGTCSGCPVTVTASFNGADLGPVTVTCNPNGNWTASVTAPLTVEGENNEIEFVVSCGTAHDSVTVDVVAL